VVKFDDLLKRVRLQGAAYLATGHYARILQGDDGRPMLAKGLDADKDQSYFLYRMTSEHLSSVLFPVGELHKPDVRAFADRLGLHVAEKPDSQETCFAPSGDYESVVAARAPAALEPGEITDEQGSVLGFHHGIARYTVGQRKGLGIGGTGEPLYVTGIDAVTNRVIVGPQTGLSVNAVTARDVVWHGEGTQRVGAAVRYRMQPRPAVARFDDGVLTVEFDEPLTGVAPGQSVVCYRDDVVLGGGVIECAS
jgi:tRNA-uridine 2-sulfurtransferase